MSLTLENNIFPKEIMESKNVEFTYNKKISDIIKIINSCDVVIGNANQPFVRRPSVTEVNELKEISNL